MLLVKAYPFDNAPPVLVTGVSLMEEIIPGIWRVTFFREQEDHDGGKEKRVVDEQLWSTANLFDALAKIREVMESMAGKNYPVTYIKDPSVH
jgi:hypothetical protein